MLIVQLAPGKTRGRQLFVCVKSLGPVLALVGVIVIPVSSSVPVPACTLIVTGIGALGSPCV